MDQKQVDKCVSVTTFHFYLKGECLNNYHLAAGTPGKMTVFPVLL